MDVITVTEEIEKCIKQLSSGLKEIKARGLELAKAIAEYDKQLAVTMIKLKNGYEFEIDGEKIKDVTATNMEKIAKGICYPHKLKLEEAEANYKSNITFLEVVRAQLNGWQSINKYLENK